jgi:hypothetical protein
MAIGSFVDGVFRGMQARDTMDNNKRLRKMEDTRFEREGEQHGWDKEKHDLAMTRARKAAAAANRPKLGDDVRGVMSGYDENSGVSSPVGQGLSIQGAIPSTPQAAPLSYGEVGAPRQMSVLPAAQPVQVAQAPMEFDYVPGQGLMPRGVA